MNNDLDKSKFIRNIAIVAHVDHGKTTLVDQLFKQAGQYLVGQERMMDSGDIERERGITILAKQTGIKYGPYTINIIDTPGHSDFGGEVERTLQMVEGFLLLVDAAEGVLPGTRFVLKKAFECNLRPIVLINKIDRKDADIEKTQGLIHDLFIDLASNEGQLDFPVLYGSGRIGFASFDPNARSGDMIPLLDTIVKTIPYPVPLVDSLQILITNIDYSDFLGAMAVGRIFSGHIKIGQSVIVCKDDVVSNSLKITKIFIFYGLSKIEVQEASYGEIVAISGFETSPAIGSTVCDVDKPIPCKYVKIDDPTLTMYFSINNSPFCGKEGSSLTARHLRERLFKELKTNLALRVEPTTSPDVFKVSGRGQLHLGILIENMRREGFELQVSAPEVIYKTINGTKCEPIEQLIIDIPSEYQGAVIENLSKRKGEMKHVEVLESGRVKLTYEIPSRGLLGFRGQFLTVTRGLGVIAMQFKGYEPYKGDIPTRNKGALVSMDDGRATPYALDLLQPRGILFIKPNDQVYAGMIIGEHTRDNDLDVNPCKTKKLTNMRASGTDEAVKIAPSTEMDLEECMEWIRPDELIEITPKSIRLRKKILQANLRKRS